MGGKDGLPDEWSKTAEMLRKTTKTMLGVTFRKGKGNRKTWWWNEEVQKSIKEKKEAKKALDKNEKNDRDPRTENAKVANKEVNCVITEEVKNALKRIKKGKVVGSDELPVNVWKCMGEMGIKFLIRLFNRRG